MARSGLTIGLGAALIVSIGLNIASWTARRPTRPNFEYAPDMAWTVRYNAFEENHNFPDGMTLRAPVPEPVGKLRPRALALHRAAVRTRDMARAPRRPWPARSPARIE